MPDDVYIYQPFNQYLCIAILLLWFSCLTDTLYERSRIKIFKKNQKNPPVKQGDSHYVTLQKVFVVTRLKNPIEKLWIEDYNLGPT